MLSPNGIAFATPDDLGNVVNYRRFCLAVGLNPVPDGYGLLLVTDEWSNQEDAHHRRRRIRADDRRGHTRSDQ
ncbi:hypothetical protein ACFZBE_41070 [Streptomyces sp. NPDC008061]|uniref:hypothetical protein n=1 Tax=Streptomyces sp. NPDC008061 TaxID=3364805 RepID=UPI0036E0FFAE